jgi:hypothetical protein
VERKGQNKIMKMSMMMEVSFKTWVKRIIKVGRNFGERLKIRENDQEWSIKNKIINIKNNSSMNSMISLTFQTKVMMQQGMIQREQI